MKRYTWTIPDSEPCDCEKCQAMCVRPCWPLPEEAEYMIELGYAGRMMSDWWVEEDGPDTYIISPALKGSEGKNAPWWPRGQCCFQTADGLCELHGKCKPYEGRISHHSSKNDQHELIAQAWDSSEGRRVVALWKAAAP